MNEFLGAVGFGFLGGVLLNVMPCVLPVLTMKVFHLMEHASEDRRSQRLHGAFYAAGVLTTFLVGALLILVLRESMRLMWGSQFQSPAFMLGIVGLLTALGLNALGVFEITPAVTVGQERTGYAASFFNGVVASIMATPCIGPFVGGAAAYAFAADRAWWAVVAVFLSLGAGLAAPFVVVSLVPAVGRLLPRPGAWMETFKNLMGLTLLGAGVFFFGSLMKQVSAESSHRMLGFLFILSAALWAWGHFGSVMYAGRRRFIVGLGAAAATVVSGVWLIRFEPAASQAAVALSFDPVVNDEINWQSFDSALVTRANEAGIPVFMDYTADWCVNCRTNERVFIEVESVRSVFVQTGIMPMQADMTVDNEEIMTWLDRLGRSGIPVYAIYLPDGSVDLLPSAITSELLIERLRQASESFPPSRFGVL